MKNGVPSVGNEDARYDADCGNHRDIEWPPLLHLITPAVKLNRCLIITGGA